MMLIIPSLMSSQTSMTFFSLCQTNYDILNGFGVNDDRLMNSDLTQVCTFIHPDY